MASAWPPWNPTTSQGMALPPRALRGLDGEPGADRHGLDGPGDLHHQPAHADHAAVDLDAVEVGDLLGQGFHFSSPASAPRVRARVGEGRADKPQSRRASHLTLPLKVEGHKTVRAHAAWRAPPLGSPALRLTGLPAALTRCLPASLIIGSSSVGLEASRIAEGGAKGESAESVRPRLLNWSMKRAVAKKPLSGNILPRFGVGLPTARLRGRIRFC